MEGIGHCCLLGLHVCITLKAGDRSSYLPFSSSPIVLVPKSELPWSLETFNFLKRDTGVDQHESDLQLATPQAVLLQL
jgi:hypothetical protein